MVRVNNRYSNCSLYSYIKNVWIDVIHLDRCQRLDRCHQGGNISCSCFGSCTRRTTNNIQKQGATERTLELGGETEAPLHHGDKRDCIRREVTTHGQHWPSPRIMQYSMECSPLSLCFLQWKKGTTGPCQHCRSFCLEVPSLILCHGDCRWTFRGHLIM